MGCGVLPSLLCGQCQADHSRQQICVFRVIADAQGVVEEGRVRIEQIVQIQRDSRALQ